VSAMAVSGGELYVGGHFRNVGGIVANNIARWDGSDWVALGSGIPGSVRVYALAVSGGEVYAAGDFSWSALGAGVSRGGTVALALALTVSGGELYAGGSFTTAGGVAATNIAKWNGSSWSALGSGIPGWYVQVSALAMSGSDGIRGRRFQDRGRSFGARNRSMERQSVVALGCDAVFHWTELLCLHADGVR
jgi:hypothetical protein